MPTIEDKFKLTLKKDVKRFFELINKEEESDSGHVFKPNRFHIDSCRVMDGLELSKILTRMENHDY